MYLPSSVRFHFHVQVGKKEKKKFDFIYMDINGGALLCRSRKKGKEKV